MSTTFSYQGATAFASLILDAVVSETDTITNTVTEHEVEEGSAVVDHAKPRARGLSISGLVSGSPMYTGENPPPTPAEAMSTLEELAANRTLVTITTPRKSYANMVIESLTLPRDKGTGNSLYFTATLREVRLVRTRETYVKVTKVSKMKPKIDQGTKPLNEDENAPAPSDVAGSPLDQGGLLKWAKRKRAEQTQRNKRGI